MVCLFVLSFCDIVCTVNTDFLLMSVQNVILAVIWLLAVVFAVCLN